MYRPKELELINLLAHKNTKYAFLNGQAVLITGVNVDDEGQEDNGSGKTTLGREALSLALTGTAGRKDIIFYGEDSCKVVFTLENEILKENFRIEREFFAKKSKSSTLKCFINGEDQKKAFPTVPDGNKWILARLGMSREDLLNYFLVNRKSKSFFGQSNNEKQVIVSRFSGTEPLYPIKDQIGKDIEAIEADKEVLETNLIKLEGKSEAFQEQLDLASTKEQKELKASRILKRNQDIANYDVQIELKEEEVKTYGSDIKSAKKSLIPHEKSKLDFVKVDYAKELGALKTSETINSKKILVKDEEIEGIQGDISEYKSFKAEIEQNLKDSIECPKCKHKFILRDEEYDLEAAKEQLPVVIESIEYLEKDKGNIEQKILDIRILQRGISTKMEGIRAKSRTQDDKLAAIDKFIQTYTDKASDREISIGFSNKKIESYKGTILELKEEIKGIESEEIIDTSIAIAVNIKANKELIAAKMLELEAVKVKYVKKKEFEGVFIRFITHLSNKAVKSIEIQTNQYLLAMGSGLSIEIEGYKVLNDGSIREKFTTVVSRDGIPENFIEGFSEGEQSRINISTIMGLNSLLNMSCDYGKGLDLVVLDELMGSLDRLGVGLAMESLNRLNQTVLAISHVQPRSPYANSLVVTKKNGVATIN